MELLSLSEERLVILLQVMNNPGEINYYFKNNYQNKIGIFVKLFSKVFMRWKNGREFKNYESMNLREEDWSKIRRLSMNSRPEFRNYRMNDLRDFKDAESVRSGLSHVPSQPALLPHYRDPGEMLNRKDKPPDIWDTHGASGNVFVNPPASSSSPYPGGFNPWISHLNGSHITACNEWTSIPRHSLGSEMPVRTVSQKFCRPWWGRLFKELWGRPTKTADFRSSFLQIPYTNKICLLEDTIQNWGMYLFTISYGS